MEEKKNNNIQDSAEGMGKIIERLHTNVEYAEREGEDMESISWGMQEGMLISYNDAKKILTAILQPKQSWIPIEEGCVMPEDEETVLIWQKNNDRAIPAEYKRKEFGRYNNSTQGDRSYYFTYPNVTHWQHLPTPPNK